MADLAITYTFVANTLAKASEVNQNFTDGKNYINLRNQGTTGWDFITLATSGLLKLPTGDTALAPALTYTGDTNTGQFYVAADTLGWTTGGTERLRLSTSTLQSALPVTITPTSNQLVLGTTNTTTINAAAPSASRILTIPDPGTTASFVMTEGVQTINGTKTFGSIPNIPSLNATNTTNQLVLGTTNTTTVSATAPAASRVYTLPDVLGTADFVMTAGTQTLTGTKTLSSFSGTLAANIGAAGFKLTGLGAGTTAGDSTRFEQLKVIQQVSLVSNSTFTTSSTTFQNTNLTLAITPTSTSNKVLILISGPLELSDTAVGTTGQATIDRNGTNLGDSSTGLFPGINLIASGTQNTVFPSAFTYMDSPASTSSQTYTFQIKCGTVDNIYFPRQAVKCTITLMEVAS